MRQFLGLAVLSAAAAFTLSAGAAHAQFGFDGSPPGAPKAFGPKPVHPDAFAPMPPPRAPMPRPQSLEPPKMKGYEPFKPVETHSVYGPSGLYPEMHQKPKKPADNSPF